MMADNNINIKLTSEQKIDRLKSGKPIYAESTLNTSGGKHEYVVSDPRISEFLKTQEVVRISATEFSKLYESGFRSIEEESKALNDRLIQINHMISVATSDDEKKKFMAESVELSKSIKKLSDFQRNSNRKAPIGTAVHKLIEMAINKEIDLSDTAIALSTAKSRNLPEISAIRTGNNDIMLQKALLAAKEILTLMSETNMVGGRTEFARSALIPKNGKIYLVSGTSDWDTNGRLGDYKTTSEFDPAHNIVQTIINAYLKRLETGKTGEFITGDVLHLPLTYLGDKRAGGSIYKINPGTFQDEQKFILDMIDVLEGKKDRTAVKLPGSYSATARYTEETSSKGETYKGIKYAGEWMSNWLKRSSEEVNAMVGMLDDKSKTTFLRQLFKVSDSGMYDRTGKTADELRSQYAPEYFANASLSKMQEAWMGNQYTDVISKIIEDKAEKDPGIIWGLVYGNQYYKTISDDFYDFVQNSSKKTKRYTELVANLGNIESDTNAP